MAKKRKKSRKAKRVDTRAPKAKLRILKKLEKEIVGQEKYPEEEIEETERELQEDEVTVSEGMGIEKEEEKGREAYPEIEAAERDPDEETEED